MVCHSSMTSSHGTEPTRQSLHTLAEAVLAGPQHARAATIRLGVRTDANETSIITTKPPEVRLNAAGLHGPAGSVALNAITTARAAGAAIGVPVARAGIYGDTSGVELDDPLTIDPDLARALLGWFGLGAQALAGFAPEHAAVLWPEHFDLAVSVGTVNYGISAGDATHSDPYAYVGPWTVPEHEFFTVSFGALRSWEEVRDPAAIMAFFDAGRRAAGAPAAV